MSQQFEKSCEDRMIKKQEKQYIRKILYELKPKHRLIILLKYWLDMPSKKIAKIIKSTPGSVNVIVSNIKKKLVEKIKKI